MLGSQFVHPNSWADVSCRVSWPRSLPVEITIMSINPVTWTKSAISSAVTEAVNELATSEELAEKMGAAVAKVVAKLIENQQSEEEMLVAFKNVILKVANDLIAVAPVIVALQPTNIEVAADAAVGVAVATKVIKWIGILNQAPALLAQANSTTPIASGAAPANNG